jgi:hypothetical protein
MAMDRAIKFGIIAAAMSTVVAGAFTWASAQEYQDKQTITQSAIGLICDTTEQVEQVVKETRSAANLGDAIKAVNAQTGDAQACAIAMIRFVAEQEVERLGTFKIERIRVIGFNDGEKWLAVEPPRVQFSILDPDGQEV